MNTNYYNNRQYNTNKKTSKNSFSNKSIEKLPVVMPKSWRCWNNYTTDVISYSNSGAIYGAFDYYINTVYRPETTGLDTTNAIGFAELASIYSNYHVEQAKFNLDFVNEESFEMIVVVAPTTYALDAIISNGGEVMQMSELPYAKSMSVGAVTGMNKGRIAINVNLSKLFGNRALYFGDQNFIGLGSARPTNLAYITIGLASLGTNTIEKGITFRLSIEFRTKWSNRKFEDLSLMSKRSLIKMDGSRFNKFKGMNKEQVEKLLISLSQDILIEKSKSEVDNHKLAILESKLEDLLLTFKNYK